MASWVVVPCLIGLRDEFNERSPKRDKGADGTIGDSNHASTSDHSADEDSTALRGKDADKVNEVHALDIDSSGPWPDGKRGDIAGSWFDTKIHDLIAEEKRRWLNPDDMCRLRYVIWKGHIYHLDSDFAAKVYTGSDPHINHAHFSARYETRAETDTRPWGVQEDDMPTAAEIAEAVVDKMRTTALVLSTQQTGDLVTRASDATATKVAAVIAPNLNKLLAAADLEAAEVPASPTAIADVVLARIGGLSTAEDIARVLLPVLGARAAEVGKLLAAATAKS